MTQDILMLGAGVLLAWFGGELFVRGGVGLARWARWPAAVIGVTVAAFGTSSPELMVAVNAAMDGVPEISLGDVLGSNVVNVSLILGIVLCISSMKADSPGLGRDWTLSLLLPAVVVVFLIDGHFSRVDAALMLLGFLGWLVAVVRQARAHAAAQPQDESEGGPPVALGKVIFHVAAGLALLIGSAQLVVFGAKGIAVALGWSPFVVGAVVVAVATSTPELATTLISTLRGHDDVGLGNILGSNIFNVLVIASVAALIHPYDVKVPELVPSLVFGAVTVLMILPDGEDRVPRWRGGVLLALYVAYTLLSLRLGGASHG